MKELFLSKKCGQSISLLESEEKNPKYSINPEVEIIDITESMANLKRFLAYRDKLPAYKSVIEKGNVGIPSLIEDGKDVTFIE